MDPEAIFGRIDPRKMNKANLDKMFDDIRKPLTPFNKYSRQKNPDSGRAKWNDVSEFATPNVQEKADQENFLVNHQNVG
jgi:hypothetical protein